MLSTDGLLAWQAKEKQRSGWEQWSSRASGAGRAARAPTGRAAILEPHIQQACAAASTAVASALDGRLGALPPAADGGAGAAVVEQALLLGAPLLLVYVTLRQPFDLQAEDCKGAADP